MACATLDALRDGRPTRLPRFDKLADTRLPPSRWPSVRGIDLTLFEGWFLKTPAQTLAELDEPINAVERDEDPDGSWRRYCNDALARDYPPLWSRLDRLLFLQPPGFEAVPQWRWQQEQACRPVPGNRAPWHDGDATWSASCSCSSGSAGRRCAACRGSPSGRCRWMRQRRPRT